MIGQKIREQLFGTGQYEPPSTLAQGVPFESDAAYLSYLSENLKDPVSYWAKLADELQWSQEPRDMGGPGDWCPEGLLNLTVSCLDTFIESDLGPEEVLVALDGQGREHFSRDDLLSRVGILAERFRQLNLTPGQRVLLAIPRGYELLTAVLGALRLGLTCVPLDPSTGHPGRIIRRAEVANCSLAMTSQSVLDAGLIPDWDKIQVPGRLVLEAGWETDAYAPPAPVAVGAMHPAFILADASGRPFALPTLGAALHGMSAYGHLLNGRGRGDLHWFQTPAHHASFLTGSLGTLIRGGRLATPLTGSLTSAAGLGEALSQVAPRVMLIQAKVLRRVAEASLKDGAAPHLSGPELLVVEGVSISPTFYRQVREQLFDGQTHVVQVLSRPETSGFVAGPHPGLSRAQGACAGWAAPGMDLSVVDHQDQACVKGRGGVLALGAVPPGLAVEMQTQDPPITLGVKVRMDQQNRFWPVAERKVERKQKERVSTTELEAVMLAEEGVTQAAVVSYRTASGGLETRAFIKSDRNGDLVDLLRDRITERFGASAVPARIQIVAQLPYSRSGKLLRSVLRRIATDDVRGLSDMELVTDREVIEQLIKDR